MFLIFSMVHISLRKLYIPHFLHVTPFLPHSAKFYLWNAEHDWNQHQWCWDVAKCKERLWVSSSSQTAELGFGTPAKAYPIWKEKKRRKSRSIPSNRGVAEQNWMEWAGRKGERDWIVSKGQKKSGNLWTLPQNFSSPVIL